MRAGSTIRLHGIVVRSTLESVDSKNVRWNIDDKEVANGLDVFVTSPSEGEHSCKLRVEDEGEITEKSVSFKTISLPNQQKKPASD